MPAANRYKGWASGPEGPYQNAFAVTKHDTDELPNVIHGLFVGGAGNIVLVTAGGNEVTLTAIPAGTWLRGMAIKQIKSTNTTATNMVGFY